LVDLISTRCVPVAVDQHVHRHLQDAEGEFFAQVLKQAGRGLDGYAQGVYLFTPEGKLLAFANTSDAGRVKGLLDTAFKKFAPSDTLFPVDDAKAVRPLPVPPPGGLVVDVTTKVLGGYDPNNRRAERYRNSLGRDHLWVRQDEAEALARGNFPDSLAARLARFHLVDNTRGEPPMWSADEIKKLAFTLEDGRLTGSIHLETKAGDRGYQADLLGFITAKEGRVTRFDLVVRGQFWGEGTFTRGAPRGKFPVAVAFGLSDGKCVANQVPPQAARGGSLKLYLR
jgi:hypothetical protein